MGRSKIRGCAPGSINATSPEIDIACMLTANVISVLTTNNIRSMANKTVIIF